MTDPIANSEPSGTEIPVLAGSLDITGPGMTSRPRRGDHVEVWLKAERDRFSRDHDTQWDVLNDMLDTYRLHADTGTLLGEHVCEQHCDCDEATGRDVSDGGQDG